MEENTYIKWPPGMKNISKNDCIICTKCIYRLVQDGSQGHYNLEKSGIQWSQCEPVVLHENDFKCVVFIALDIDTS